MLFITNFKSTNEVKQASKAVGSTAVETMVTEDAVGCVFESKDFGGIQIICDYGFNDVAIRPRGKTDVSTRFLFASRCLSPRVIVCRCI